MAEAGRMAGIKTRVGAHKTYNVIKRRAPEILEEIGYGRTRALSDLVEMTQAKEVKIGWDKGIII